MSEPTNKTVSIVGCGWLGFPLASRLRESGYAVVKGSTTSPEKLPKLREAGVEAYVAALDPEPRGQEWASLLQTDRLVVDIPPRLSRQSGDFHPQQMRNLAALIENSLISEIIYVSSTSVYPEMSRVMVEEDVTHAEDSASPFLVQAEQVMTSLRRKGRTVAVLRFGGLMGYDRIPGKYVRGKKDLTTGDVPVNYVHRDDAVALIEALLARGTDDETYNGVAPEHPTRRSVYEKSCWENAWEIPTFFDPASPAPYKKVSSKKITQHLGFTFAYPDPLSFHYEAISE